MAKKRPGGERDSLPYLTGYLDDIFSTRVQIIHLGWVLFAQICKSRESKGPLLW